MRANEFITEKKDGKLTKRQQNPTRGVNKFTDGDKWNADYTQFRLGMALAGTDGKNMPELDAESWAGKSKTAHPYTKVEQDMLKMAYKAVGASYQDLNNGDMKSKELDDTYTTSPVNDWNKK